MLSRKNRLSRANFDHLLKRGSFCSSSYLTLRFLEESSSRFSFVVSKKVAKTAVMRNLLRRRGYSIIKNLLPLFSLKKHYLTAFILKKGCPQLTYAQYKIEIEGILRKSKII
jgi:ribonuclease P protein component